MANIFGTKYDKDNRARMSEGKKGLLGLNQILRPVRNQHPNAYQKFEVFTPKKLRSYTKLLISWRFSSRQMTKNREGVLPTFRKRSPRLQCHWNGVVLHSECKWNHRNTSRWCPEAPKFLVRNGTASGGLSGNILPVFLVVLICDVPCVLSYCLTYIYMVGELNAKFAETASIANKHSCYWESQWRTLEADYTNKRTQHCMQTN